MEKSSYLHISLQVPFQHTRRGISVPVALFGFLAATQVVKNPITLYNIVSEPKSGKINPCN